MIPPFTATCQCGRQTTFRVIWQHGCQDTWSGSTYPLAQLTPHFPGWGHVIKHGSWHRNKHCLLCVVRYHCCITTHFKLTIKRIVLTTVSLAGKHADFVNERVELYLRIAWGRGGSQPIRLTYPLWCGPMELWHFMNKKAGFYLCPKFPLARMLLQRRKSTAQVGRVSGETLSKWYYSARKPAGKHPSTIMSIFLPFETCVCQIC